MFLNKTKNIYEKLEIINSCCVILTHIFLFKIGCTHDKNISLMHTEVEKTKIKYK